MQEIMTVSQKQQKTPMDVDEEIFASHLEAAEQAIKKMIDSNKKLGLPAAATVHLGCYQKALQKAKLSKPKKTVTLHAFGFAKSTEKK